MKFCPQCRKTFTGVDLACPEHGEVLENDALLGTDLGNFHVESWLGEGGMAVLYRAEHREIKLKVAVKVIKREYLEDASMAGRFVQEARMVAQLRHPHLVDIFDIGTLPDGRLYYVMELLAGRSLAQRMLEGPLSFQEFAPLLAQACDALELAHQQGIVHRDLKPDNLFIVEPKGEHPGESPYIKVLDFGVAKVLRTDENLQEKWTRTGYIMGTPQYMAPEQIEGVDTDPRADIYAMGVILYELATGRLPFQAQTLGGMLKAHLIESPPAFEPSQLAPGVPIELEAVTFKALVKRREDRYGTIHELRVELERLLAAQPPEASEWWVARAKSGETPVETLPGHLRTTQVQKLSSLSVTQPGLVAGRSLTASILGPGPGSKRRQVWLGVGAAVLLGTSVWAGWSLRARRSVAPASVVTAEPAPSPPAKKKRKSRPSLQTLKSRALAVITPALSDGDPLVRRFAIEALAAGKDGHHRTLVEPLLKDAALDVRAAAATCLASLGSKEVCEALREAFGQDPAVDLALALALVQLDDPRGRQALERLFQHGRDRVQLQAALALVERSSKPSEQWLRRRLGHLPATDPTTLAILGSLAKAGDAKALAQLAQQLEASDARAQLLAADTLARLGDKRGRRKLGQIGSEPGPRRLLAYRMLATLDDQSGFEMFRQIFVDPAQPVPERVLAAQGLGASGEKSALDPLLLALGDAEPALRLGAAGAILAIIAADPQILVARSLDWASNALGDSNWLVRTQAVALLGGADSEAALSLLGKALKDERVEVRRAAAKSLGQMRQREAVRYLGEALKDSNEEVRIAALRSLGHRGDEASAPLLAQHLATASPEEKVVAAGQLLALGDKSHLKEVRDALGASDPEVRRLAVEEAAHDKDLQKEAIRVALKDRSAEVRLQAALQLAEQGSQEGASVLQEAVRKGGASGLLAYAALTRLGIKPAAALDPTALLQSRKAEERVQALKSARALPAEQLLPLLQRGLADAEPQVQQAALEALEDFAGDDPRGERAQAALPLLKKLVAEGGAATQARAGLLVARLSPPAAPTADVEEDAEDADPEPAAQPAPAAQPGEPEPADTPDLAPSSQAGDLATGASALPSRGQGTGQGTGVRGSSAPPEDPTQGQPDEGQMAMTSGELALQAGKYTKAIEELRRAQKLDPKLPVAFSLAEAYRQMGAHAIDLSRQRAAYRQALGYYRRSRDRRARAYVQELEERLKE